MTHKTIVTISRQYGSGGRIIGEKLAKQLGIPFYDKALIDMASKESGLHEKIFENVDERATSSLLYSLSLGAYSGSGNRGDISTGLSLNDQVFVAQSRVIRDVAEKGPCVIVGRCADYILEENPDVVHIFIRAPFEDRVQRAVQLYHVPQEDAKVFVQKSDKQRASYYDYYTGNKWGQVENYDLVLNSSTVGLEGAVQLIAEFVRLRDQAAE